MRYSLYDVASDNSRGAGALNAATASAGLDNLDQSLAVSNTLTLSARTVNETRVQIAGSDLKALPTDPIGPGAVLFTREFYAGCRKALAPGGVLVTQNGLPFLQAGELKQSVGYFREMFADAFAYLATTPTYVGGPMSYGWASDDADLRHLRQDAIEHRYAEAGCFPTRYWRPDVHVAAFALPNYVRELVE